MVITNLAGSVTSITAQVRVTFPPAAVRIVGGSAQGGVTATVPITLQANGNENALGLSLNFDPALLTFAGANLGEGAPGGSLLVNSSSAALGSVGLAVALAPDAAFGAGTWEVAQVTFTCAAVSAPAVASVQFGDSPILRQLSDVPGNPLEATFADGTLSIAATEYEGDVAPRPGGNRSPTVTDWVLVGRYAARFDDPTNAIEFQRADCAPRATLGDGAIRVTDWVQTGRYAAGLDPLTPAGGPDTELTPPNPPPADDPGGSPGRFVEISSLTLFPGETGTAEVSLQSEGGENALGFSLAFDPAVLRFNGASLGSAASGATLNVNAAAAGAGKVGVAVALGTGNSFAAGAKQVIKVSFRAAAASGTCSVSFSDQPVPREVSDPKALALAADYANGTVSVNPLPALRITQSAQQVNLSWPLWATNFVLQEAGGLLSPADWTTVSSPVTTSNNQNVLTLPPSESGRFYRLFRP